MVSIPERVDKALELIHNYGEIDGDHHKKWLLDQLVRVLAPDYKEWVKGFEWGEDGENTYNWDEGIAP